MNKKGQLAGWYVDFICVFFFLLAIVLALIVFQVGGLGKTKMVDIEAKQMSLQNTPVLLGYLNAPVHIPEYGIVKMRYLIDLYARDPGRWRRVLEIHTKDFTKDSTYFIGIDDRKPEATNIYFQLLISPLALLITPPTILDYVPLITSNGQVLWVVLLTG